MQKLDLKKDLKHLYKPSTKQVSVVIVPKMNFLMVDGKGNPGTAPAYGQAVQALYSLAYSIRFAIKKSQEIAYTVMPLQGLWWAEDMNDFVMNRKDNWLWTMMILQPDFVTAELVEEQCREIAKKKDLPALPKVRFESYDEGQAAQLMHIGPYADEGPNIAKIHAFIEAQGHTLSGKHHEIYLSDPNRVAPEKLKTIIRQPFT